jgi:hypothetical protein
MTILFMLWTLAAEAGEVFGISSVGANVYAFEARTMTYRWMSSGSARLPPYGTIEGDILGLAYDPYSDLLYASTAMYVGNDLLLSKSPGHNEWTTLVLGGVNLGVMSATASLSFDPAVGVIAFSPTRIWRPWPYPEMDLGIPPGIGSADHYSHGGYTVGVAYGAGGALEMVGVMPGVAPWSLAPLPAVLDAPQAAGYDGDLQVFWIQNAYGLSRHNGETYFPTIGFDATTWSIVAKVWLPYSAGLAGSRDNIPFPYPALLVTGDCPGTMYVTLADGTPGGEAVFVSSNRHGSHAVSGGPCAGETVDLARPRERARLTIGSNGLASTSFEATAEQCSVLQVQAVDLATCVKTEVQTVQTAFIPWDRPPGGYTR